MLWLRVGYRGIVLSLSNAKSLLERCNTPEGMEQCSRELGFNESLPLGERLRDSVGIPPEIADARLAEGSGALRCLLLRLIPDTFARELVQAVANRMSRQTPHLLCIVITCDGRSHAGVAAWSSDRATPKIVAITMNTKRVTESDAHTLCALASACSFSDLLTYTRWLEILGRDAITLRFYRTLNDVIRQLVDSLPPEIERRDAADLSLLFVSRLLFLSFLESKGWLDRDFDFLSNAYLQVMTSGGGFHRRVLAPLFFGTLNTPMKKRASRAKEFGMIPFLNGGLFARTPLERKIGRFAFCDDALGVVFGDLLTRYRFTPREQERDWSDSAIDPEILGRSFESLMASRSRKTSGAFYTPQEIVRRVTDAALSHALVALKLSESTVDSLLAGESPESPEIVRRTLDDLRIIDPACGSGAFLVHALERMASLSELAGDSRSISERRREILARSIFGVDINPTAVWLCELRLWLSVVIERPETNPMAVPTLPNLDRNIRVGDSLSSVDIFEYGIARDTSRISVLRRRYVRATGSRKKLLARNLDRAERSTALELIQRRSVALHLMRRELIEAARSRDLFGKRPDQFLKRRHELREELRGLGRDKKACLAGAALPFSFQSHFAEVAASGGFNLVMGNPPWVRVHNIPRDSRELYRRLYSVCRVPGWKSGADAARAGSGFSSQTDLAALFVERSIGLCSSRGVVALLLPVKLWRSLAGGSLRSFLCRNSDLCRLEDYSGGRAVFDAATYPGLLVARKSSRLQQERALDPDTARQNAWAGKTLRASTCTRDATLHWRMPATLLPFDHSEGSPWLLIPPEIRESFDRVRAASVPLSKTRLGRPLLGVKTGLNEAFVVTPVRVGDDETEISSGEITGQIETKMLRPLLRGESLSEWKANATSERIIWTQDGVRARTSLPPLTKQWLSRWQFELRRRADSRSEAWWQLFRTESAAYDVDRVVWPDIGRSPRACLLPAGNATVALNSCYVVRCSDPVDACALTTLINSPLIASWLKILAEPAQGGYQRYLGWTMALLPVPRQWNRVRRSLAKLCQKAQRGNPPSAEEIFNKTLAAFELTPEDVTHMMLWMDR